MLETISSLTLAHVTGGCGRDPGFNTGITGGMNVPNNQVPRPGSAGRDKGFNTGITGGIKGINNKVPRP